MEIAGNKRRPPPREQQRPFRQPWLWPGAGHVPGLGRDTEAGPGAQNAPVGKWGLGGVLVEAVAREGEAAPEEPVSPVLG